LSVEEDERDDRFGGVRGDTPTPPSKLTLDFFFDLLRFRLFVRGERIETELKIMGKLGKRIW